MRRLISTIMILICGAAFTSSTMARAGAAHQAVAPILYRYAACAFELDAPTVEEQVAKCSELRRELEEEADEILPRYYIRNRRQTRTLLTTQLDAIETEARLAREQRKTMPPAIAAYLGCMGERVMQTERYRAGVAIDYIGIEEPCANEHVFSVEWVRTEQELERVKILYRRFALTGRYQDSSRMGTVVDSSPDGVFARRRARSRSRARTVQGPQAYVQFGTNGFIGLDRLPADEASND